MTTIFEARTLLLLEISRTRAGALALLDANVIPTLRDTGLFAADPDLGFDLNATDPTALVRSMRHITTTSTASSTQKTALFTYFSLLRSCLRLLLSTFLNFGPENEKIIYLIRAFLADYRGNMVGLFKRAAGLSFAGQAEQGSLFGASGMGSKEDREMKRVVEDCTKAYTGLAVGSGFLDFEEESGLAGNGIGRDSGFGRSHLNGGGFT